MTSNRIIAAAATLALAVTPAALAKQADRGSAPPAAHHGKAKGKAKPRNVVLKGVVVSSDATTVTVTVTKATRHGRSLVGTDAVFTVARVNVADTNADGAMNSLDLVAGDKVVVQARIGRDDVAPYRARKVVDQTHPRPSESTETETAGAPAS
jgi:hypothetical protein